MSTIAIIVAGGKGVRFGGTAPKQFRTIDNKPLLSWTVEQFQRAESIDNIVLVVPEEYLLYTHEKVVDPYDFSKLSKIITGGETRQQSVLRGLESIPLTTKFVAIHDGARPAVSPADIDMVVEAAIRQNAAILARPITNTVKRVEADYIISTLDREKLYQAETPQVFQYDLILSAHREMKDIPTATDDAFLIEKKGFKVRTVVPKFPNYKVTDEYDLELIRYLLKEKHETEN